MLLGATIDRVDKAELTARACARLPGNRIFRIVNDRGMSPANYSYLANKLRPLGNILWLPCDSTMTKQISTPELKSRYRNYARQSKPGEIIEVNEVNGPWAGKKSFEKAVTGIEVAREFKRDALLTLYFEGGDFSDVWRWLDENPDKEGSRQSRLQAATHVGVSYYPRQRNPIWAKDWWMVFSELGNRFPNARLMFSEIGDEKYDEDDEPVPASTHDTMDIILYARDIALALKDKPRFDGGFFWWSFVQEMARGMFNTEYCEAFSFLGINE